MGLYVEGATFDTPQLCCGVVHSGLLVQMAFGEWGNCQQHKPGDIES